jgi:hypothetical protein
MRHLPLLLILTTACPAQTDFSRVLAEGIKGTFRSLEPVAEKDRDALLTATATLLSKHVTFRPDGTAASFYSQGGARRAMEWKRLVVTRISAQNVTEADRLNGVTRRFLVSFGCDAHRTWDTHGNAWGKWHATGNPLFPTGLFFEWKNNAWAASGAERLKAFTPGPGPSIADPKATGGKGNAKDSGLPPGMSRK